VLARGSNDLVPRSALTMPNLESPSNAPVPAPLGSTRRAVRGELARAAGNALLLPLRIGQCLGAGARRRRRRRVELEAFQAVENAALERLPGRALRLFVASAEASGEHHAVRLIQALRAELAARGAPTPTILALGGARTRALGIETLGDPLARAAMGLDPLRSLSYYRRLLLETGARLADFRPDLVIPVDSPALFVPLARVARAAGLRTAHHIAPQYWAWAPWRVKAYRESFEHALTILPFEPAFWAAHGVATTHVGHPALDGLPPAPPADDPARRALVLLPGSRAGVIERNLGWMLATARELHRRHPNLPIVLAHAHVELRATLAAALRAARAEDWVELALGDLHATLTRARAALSVSGTVLIDLLHQRLPAAVVYRVGNPFSSWAAPHLLDVPWFSSVNLLARAPVYWEACFHGKGPREACLAHLEQALFDPAVRAATLETLAAAAQRLGPSGATGRAARRLLSLAAA
jgi:lipid-A-disaccharide synthase